MQPSHKTGRDRRNPVRRAQYRCVLRRGWRRTCPQCGRGAIFARWYTLAESCDHCGLAFERREGDTWWFMYISTAMITGVFFVGMLLMRPTAILGYQLLLLPAALAVILGTLPRRKGLAIAVDYLAEWLWENEGQLRFEDDRTCDDR